MGQHSEGYNAVQAIHERRQQRQEHAFQWALDVYGERVKDRRYQALRLLEEAMELAQAQGLTLEDAERTARFVFARKVGDTKVEIGDLALCLDILAENLGLSVDACHTTCLNRVKSLDPAAALAKDDVKVEAGLI